MEREYHLGLLKEGSNVVLEVADSVDQLSCELFRYLGARLNTVKRLKATAPELLGHINREFGTTFGKLTIRRIHSRDFHAGHFDNLL